VTCEPLLVTENRSVPDGACSAETSQAESEASTVTEPAATEAESGARA